MPLTAGASKLKRDSPVPTIPTTVSPANPTPPRWVDRAHSTSVLVVQLVLAQFSPTARELDGERSVESKLRPLIDTIAPSPLLGWLNLATSLTTGASKLSVRRPVPTTLPTVIIDVPASTTTVGLRQVTVVEDVHADVPQTASDTAAVAERS
jgi:hypothetical protein